jgi:hypothetical protein
MLPEHRQLLMRSNRLLGAGLVEANLVKLEDLEKANEKLLEVMSADQPRQSTVLGILAYQMKALREEDLLQHVVDNEGTGLVDLRGYDVPDEVRKNTDIPTCWATWSVPFDHDEDFHFIATAYYLSPAVRSFWEKQFSGPILWFGSTLEVIADYLEKLVAERVAPQQPAAGGSRHPFGTPGTRSPFGTISPFPVKPTGSAHPFAPTAPAAPAAPSSNSSPPIPLAPAPRN